MFKKFFTVAYMFGPYAIEMSRSEKLFFVLSVLLVVLSGIVYISKRTSKDALQRGLAARWFHVTFWTGLLGLVWAGLRYETIEYLSANAIVVLIFVAGAVWAICVASYQLTTYRQLRAEYDREQQKNKYL
jgi:hypothetical protein